MIPQDVNQPDDDEDGDEVGAMPSLDTQLLADNFTLDEVGRKTSLLTLVLDLALILKRKYFT